MFDFLTLNPEQLQFSPFTIFLNIILSFFLFIIIAWVYKKTHEGISYSKNFVVTIIMMGVLISIVMLLVGNNLARAFTLLGAFTIIRFRTAVKDTRDLGFIFWALVIGMAVGTANYFSAFFATILIAMIMFILSKFNFGSIKNYDHLLTFILETKEGSSDAYSSTFNKFLRFNNLVNVATRDDGTLDFTFTIRLKNIKDEVVFINELKSIKGIYNLNLVSSAGDAEY